MACLVLVAVLTGCVHNPQGEREVSVAARVTTPRIRFVQMSHPLDPLAGVGAGVALAEYLDAVRWAAIVRFAEAEARSVVTISARYGRVESGTNPAGVPSASAACGGDLPPCYVMNRESGGDYTAYASSGCHGPCYGKWQFDARTWDAEARAMGRSDLVGDYFASPDDQDAVARYLWAGGAGCAAWDAC